MSDIDLSVIVPSIRVANLPALHASLEASCAPHSFEMVVVSPYEIPAELLSKPNVKYLNDFGCPSRCVQRGSTIAEGHLVMWMSDDAESSKAGSLGECISLFQNGTITEKDAICLRYVEGDNDESVFPDEYWSAHTHPDQRLTGIPSHYKIAPLGLYSLSFFRSIGGLDCQWEHINYNLHDLAFRLQRNGGNIYLSPSYCAKFYWSWITSDSGPVQEAWRCNDKDLFAQVYSQDQSSRIKINYENWKQSPEKWKRRFGNE